VTARLDAATTVREGQDVQLWVDVRALHVFDPANGQNITLGARDHAGQPAPGQTAPGQPTAGGDVVG
jgi:multiple sugar transport system ATP-binding protein